MNWSLCKLLEYICLCNNIRYFLDKSNDISMTPSTEPKHRKCRACCIKYGFQHNINSMNNFLIDRMKIKKVTNCNKEEKHCKSTEKLCSKRHNSDPTNNSSKSKECLTKVNDLNCKDTVPCKGDPMQQKKIKKGIKTKKNKISGLYYNSHGEYIDTGIVRNSNNNKTSNDVIVNEMCMDYPNCLDFQDNRIYCNFKGYIKMKRDLTNQYEDISCKNGECMEGIEYTLLTMHTPCECCNIEEYNYHTQYIHFPDYEECCCIHEDRC